MTTERTTIQWVPLDQIYAHPRNPRIITREDVIDGIVANITEGFDPAHALIVRPIKEGYEIISGHHRKAAAEKAGLPSVPCWVRDMDDEAAYMALATCNSQGELSPLEIGMHALHCVSLDEKRGRGQKGGLSSYSSRIGKAKQNVSSYRNAAQVAEKCHIDMTLLQDKAAHLAAIHAAPQETWPPLVQYVLDNNLNAKQSAAKADAIKHLAAAIPAWWQVHLDVAALTQKALESDRTADRWRKALELAGELAGQLGEATIYSHADSGERREVDGREYEVHRATAETYDARSDFIEQVTKSNTTPSPDEIRKIKRQIEDYITANSDSGDKLVAVETEAEYRARLEREREREAERQRDEIRQLVVCGDCRDSMRAWQGEKIRLLMTDPPYGMAFQSNRRTASNKAAAIQGDSDNATATALLADVLRASYPNMAEDAHAVVFCHDDSFEAIKAAVEGAGFIFKRILVWVKPNHTSGDLHGCFAPRKELAVHAVKGKPDVSPRRDDVYVQTSWSRQTKHPAEKPVELLAYWLQALTDEGDVIVDPFAGTGATLAAGIQSGRRVWGVEIDEDYRQVAADRLVEVSDV